MSSGNPSGIPPPIVRRPIAFGQLVIAHNAAARNAMIAMAPTRPVAQHQVPAVQPEPAKKKRASFKRTTRSNAEWRAELLGIYAGRFPDPKGISLRSYVGVDHYKRVQYVWKQLSLEQSLLDGINPANPVLVATINERFPVIDRVNENQTTKQRNRTNPTNEMRTNADWRKLLLNIYEFLLSAKANQRRESVHSYCAKVLQSTSQYRRIQDVWKEVGFCSLFELGACFSDNRLKQALDAKFPETETTEQTMELDAPARRRRDLSVSSNSYFNQDEEAVLCESVAAFAKLGYPMNKNNLKAYADAFMAAEGLMTDANGGISMDTIERIYKEGRMKAKANVNPIDPKRASQADPQVLNAFFHQLDAWIKIAHEVNPEVWPEDRYANVPPSRIYNTDEQGPNPTALRNPVLIPEEMVTNLSRLFQNTREGDGKMQFHYSVANIVRADGAQCHPHESVEGAPAPYVIISDGSSSNDLDNMEKADRDKALANQSESNTRIQLNAAVLEGWFDEFEVGSKDDIVNKFGFQVRTTPTGSMLKRTFYDFILHFTKQLPHDQGPNGIGVVLFLDWHCSRECPQSLILAFLKYNILIFVLPSKTSIWAQPCDNGKNELTAKDIAHAAHNLGLFVGSALDYRDANRVFRAGLEANCVQQNDELRRTGSNAAATSFAKTGLYPMSYENEGWNNAFQTFNKLNQLVKQKKQESGEKIPTIVWVTKPRPIDEREPLSEAEEESIRSFLSKDDFLLGTDSSDAVSETTEAIDLPLLFLAVAIGDHLLGVYAEDENRDIDNPPTATHDYEEAALKLVQFVGVTKDNRVDTNCTLTEEEIARDKLRTRLSVLKFGEAITLRKKETNRHGEHLTIKLMKQHVSRFLVLDNQRRQSRNLVTMTARDLIENYFDNSDDETYTLTKKDKRKHQKKARVARKRLNMSMCDEAKERADMQRLERNVSLITERLSTKRSRFASKLATLMEEEELDMEQLYLDFEGVVFEPYADTISVTRGEVSKDISVTRVGTDTTAVGHLMETVLTKLMLDLKSKGPDKKKRKRRRGAGQATNLGKSGLSVGILIQRQNKMEEVKSLQKEEKSLVDAVKRAKLLLAQAKEIVDSQELKDSFWKWDIVKGKKREILARLCGVYKSSNNAAEVAASLKSLQLTKESVLAKIKALAESIAAKERTIAPVVAERREREDFLLCTAAHAESEKEDDDVEEEE
ncbi:unknown protein [Seminavis robusta]|uniref:Uncharacterized protein n=1 Tax=Seminavis robusta TaxID=568900 RepID=A0A9N8HBM6_9STRA|nr:unknown protein [Seminavis robusta]|eukprot:Sro188_g081260.1 n/a (1204) ;mRNA; r:66162-69773